MQVQWAKMLCELIQISKTPQEYISRVFARDSDAKNAPQNGFGKVGKLGKLGKVGKGK